MLPLKGAVGFEVECSIARVFTFPHHLAQFLVAHSLPQAEFAN
jgi:hypothetical protein